MGLCEELAARGATVVSADLNGQPPLDVRDFDGVKRLVQDTCAKHGRLDFMFNNAAIAVVGEVRDTTPEHWRKILDVNLMGVIYGTLAAYAAMIPQGSGHIVNVSSVTGLIPTPVLAPYGTTKWAIIGFTQSLRPEAATFGIQVSVACPSLARTNIPDRSTYLNVSKEDYIARLPQRWMMDPREVARKMLLGVQKNRGIIVFPWHARLLWWLYRFSPGLLSPLSNKTVSEWRKLRRERV